MTDTPDEFTPPPAEPRWGGIGPSDRNAEPLGEAEQAEEDAANADA